MIKSILFIFILILIAYRINAQEKFDLPLIQRLVESTTEYKLTKTYVEKRVYSLGIPKEAFVVLAPIASGKFRHTLDHHTIEYALNSNILYKFSFDF